MKGRNIKSCISYIKEETISGGSCFEVTFRSILIIIHKIHSTNGLVQQGGGVNTAGKERMLTAPHISPPNQK